MSFKPGKAITKFWSEVTRRRVVKSSIAYVVVAWIIVEGATTIFPSLLLPEWTVRLVVAIAILGLPLVIILAWVFDIEIKPELTKAKDSELETEQPGSRIKRLHSPPSLASAIASVAVMPFRNLSPDEAHRYLADGIATELHSTLAKVHRLRVASRTSSFSIAGKNLDVREIARRLDVHFVIGGSVECIDGRMRLIVDLDNADEGIQIWTATYDRALEDIFSIQQEIAIAVASEFGGIRLRDEITSASNRPTDSLNAWSLVQRARSYTLSFTPKALSEAVPLLQQAIKLDSDYAAAHAALASVLAEQVLNGLSDDIEGARRSALESAEKASALAPLDSFVLKMCGATWAYFGKPELSINELRQAVAIAPFDFGAWGFMGWPLAETGNRKDLLELQEVMERILKAAPLHPGAPYWLYHRSVACSCDGQLERAVKFANQSVSKNPGFPWSLMQNANALGMVDDLMGAAESVNRARKISPGLTLDHYEFMIRGMCASDEFVQSRLAGLQRLGLHAGQSSASRESLE